MLAAFAYNDALFRERVFLGPRAAPYDETLVENLSGARVGGKAISGRLLHEWWADTVEPALRDLWRDLRAVADRFNTPPGPPDAEGPEDDPDPPPAEAALPPDAPVPDEPPDPPDAAVDDDPGLDLPELEPLGPTIVDAEGSLLPVIDLRGVGTWFETTIDMLATTLSSLPALDNVSMRCWSVLLTQACMEWADNFPAIAFDHVFTIMMLPPLNTWLIPATHHIHEFFNRQERFKDCLYWAHEYLSPCGSEEELHLAMLCFLNDNSSTLERYGVTNFEVAPGFRAHEAQSTTMNRTSPGTV